MMVGMTFIRTLFIILETGDKSCMYKARLSVLLIIA